MQKAGKRFRKAFKKSMIYVGIGFANMTTMMSSFDSPYHHAYNYTNYWTDGYSSYHEIQYIFFLSNCVNPLFQIAVQLASSCENHR